MQDSEFSQDFTTTLDKCVTLFDQYMVIGDLNYDLLCETKGKPLVHSVLTICTQTGTCDTRSGDLVFFSATFDGFSLFTKN